ncbi:MAG: LON peptidase substrate-binding domain-containing protein [Actinobacteria bacterium]|nr:LON peptidase substrate-binding domain-containing protein [Actinomycetota bacterium]
MQEIGLFPLGTVLLPTERMPLHIFEPRYQELIGECLEDDVEFGLILADDDGLREIGTRAAVVEVLDRLEDGRLNVVVEGRERFRVRELTSGRSFQTGEIEPLRDDAEDEATADEVERALGLMRRLAELAGADVEGLEVTTDTPSFELAARVEFDPLLKQRLLELRSEPERLRTLTELLERAARMLELRQIGERSAQTNGKIPHPPQE